MSKSLDTPVRYIKGIGPKRSQIINKLGINTIEELLYYFPRRYEDRTKFSSIVQLKEGQIATIKVEVLVRGERRSLRRRGFSIFEVVVGDQTGKIFCIWFNQPYLKEYFKVGSSVILYGKVERYAERLQMNSPEFEFISGNVDESLNLGRIVPIYSLMPGITQRYFRRIVKYALDKYVSQINDFLPYDIRLKQNLLNLAKSIINIHFPDNLALQADAYRRLAFEEFFLFQLPLALRKLKKKEKIGISHQVEGKLVDDFILSLPFRLTRAQEKVILEIKQDMASIQVMQRLLQGDVGSGKTVVAIIAGLMAIQGGYQVAFMVPTEILAKQHLEKITRQLSVASHNLKKINLGLLVSSLSKKKKEKVYQEIKEGKIDLVIGTHALLEESVQFKNLGLAIIDEQHKFGVGQRALLPTKGLNPDVLIMTATPIPRTLAITLYGDLDISVINELPPGRKPIITKLINETQREWLYGFLKENVRLGRQVYIVYPVIEESFHLDLLSAKKMYRELKNNVFRDFKVGLIHGKLKDTEQERIMSEFKSAKLQILVATTVLEVGIDIANATIMVIEQAERFGLSQLHQLRGRVGRGAYESYCILISEADSPDARLRLEAMVKYNDGFFIAEEDLKIRGPGEFFGSRQHGLTELKIGNPLTQMQLLKRAREEAIRLVNLDPQLKARQNILLKEKLLKRFPDYEKLMFAG
jgi:ATP-dependent DNA helicase RecG